MLVLSKYQGPYDVERARPYCVMISSGSLSNADGAASSSGPSIGAFSMDGRGWILSKPVAVMTAMSLPQSLSISMPRVTRRRLQRTGREVVLMDIRIVRTPDGNPFVCVTWCWWDP